MFFKVLNIFFSTFKGSLYFILIIIESIYLHTFINHKSQYSQLKLKIHLNLIHPKYDSLIHIFVFCFFITYKFC